MRAVLFVDWRSYNTPLKWCLNAVFPISVLVYEMVFTGSGSVSGAMSMGVLLSPMFVICPSYFAALGVLDDCRSGVFALFCQSGRGPLKYVVSKAVIPMAIGLALYALNCGYLWCAGLGLDGFLAMLVHGFGALAATVVCVVSVVMPLCLVSRRRDDDGTRTLVMFVVTGLAVGLVVVDALADPLLHVVPSVTGPLVAGGLVVVSMALSWRILHGRYPRTIEVVRHA